MEGEGEDDSMGPVVDERRHGDEMAASQRECATLVGPTQE